MLHFGLSQNYRKLEIICTDAFSECSIIEVREVQAQFLKNILKLYRLFHPKLRILRGSLIQME